MKLITPAGHWAAQPWPYLARKITRSLPLLRTSLEWGRYTDGTIVSLLSPDGGERRDLEQVYNRLLTLRSDPSEAPPPAYDLRRALPKLLGPAALVAVYAGFVREAAVMLRERRGQGGRTALVAGVPFLTLTGRHPDAEWRLPHGPDSLGLPVVLLGRGALDYDLLVGALRPLPVLEGQILAGDPGGTPTYALAGEGREIRYEELES